MRPYVIEVLMVFAAGLCVGAWLNERKHEQNSCIPIEEDPEPVPVVTEKISAEKKKGWFVSLQKGKLIIDPTGGR